MPEPYRESFASLGEFLAAAAHASNNPALVWDPRLQSAIMSSVDSGSGLPSSGLFLVPEEQAQDLFELTCDVGQLLSLCTLWPSSKRSFMVPVIDEESRANGSRFGGVKMAWLPEGERIESSKAKFCSRQMNRNALKGLVNVTDALFEDAPSLGATFERLFSLEASFVLEDHVINGNGAGVPLGVLNADCTITVDAEANQTAGSVVAGNVVKMFSRLWSPSKRRAVWVVDTGVTEQLYGLSWNGTGLFSWAADGTPLLLGRPIMEAEYSAQTGSRGDIVLGDFHEYFVADAQGLSVAYSNLGPGLFDTASGAFRFRLRVDGQPAWRVPTTPKNGGPTVSPFVTLAARE